MGNRVFKRKSASSKCAHSFDEDVIYLLTHNDDVRRLKKRACHKLNPAQPIYLQMAALRKNNCAVLHFLLTEMHFDADVLDPNGDSIMHYCAMSGNHKNLDFLLHFGAQINFVNQDKFSLFHTLVFQRNQRRQVMKVLRFGADPEFSALRIAEDAPITNRYATTADMLAHLEKFMRKALHETICEICGHEVIDSMRGVCGFCAH